MQSTLNEPDKFFVRVTLAKDGKDEVFFAVRDEEAVFTHARCYEIMDEIIAQAVETGHDATFRLFSLRDLSDAAERSSNS